jgi:parvulin-like peptidyl-prolyl isomerase
MTPLAKFSLRLAIYGGVLAYLAGDLFVFQGPLRRKIERANPGSEEAITEAKARGVVARVFNHRITRDQLERAVHERLWLEGKTPEFLAPENRRMVRYAALDELIDHELLRVKAKANAPQLKVTDGELNERLRRMLGRFVSKGEMEQAMKSQGIASERDLRDRLAARIQQEKYVELKIGPLVQVTEEEARAWFAENQAQLATPERIEARHVFIATLERPQEEAKALLGTALADLTAGRKDFATLALELSHDPATKDQGGNLGWMTRERLPSDFSAEVFALPLNKPSLIRTRIGWHLVEVTGRKPSEPRTFEEVKPEVIAALEAVKRREAATEFRNALRRFEFNKIEVFHDMMVR